MLAMIRSLNEVFAHAVTLDGDSIRVFVHQSECDFDLRDCLKDDRIDIGDIEQTSRGLRGRQVRWVERPERAPVSTPDPFQGTVVYVCQDERKFCFVRPDGSQAVGTNKQADDVMVHITGFTDYGRNVDEFGKPTSETFEMLNRGDRLCGLLRRTGRGKKGERMAPAN